METLQARTDSFAKTKRVKNPSKPSSYVTLKWPHPSNFKANADTLAEAGFFYAPSYDDPDNVTCFVCGKELSGWETEDDPFDIHWEKCGKRCCWASVRCGLRGDMDRYGRYTFPDKTRLPTSKAMEKARQETFSVGGGWIHDEVKNHGANSKKMALAGFVCTPQHVGDDLATCMYCHISLSGWDEEDDPLEEHRKRMKQGQICPMFSSSSPDPIPAKPSSRSQSTKPPSKPQSRTASRSKTTTHQDILMPTKTYDGDPDAESDSESTATGRVAAKTPRKGRSISGSSKSSAKTPARSHTRSTSRSGLRDVIEDDETEAEETILAPPPTVKKRTRSRSKSVARNATEDEEVDDEEAITAPPPTVKKNARSRSRSVARNATEDKEAEDEEAIPAPPPTVKKNARSRSRSVAKNVVEEEAITAEATIPPTVKKNARSTAKAVARSETPDQSEAGDHDEPVPRKTSSRTKAKAKLTPTDDTEDEVPRKPSRSKSKPPPPPAEAVEDTATRKPSRTKSKIKIFDEEDVVEPARKSRPVSKAKPAPPREPTRAKATPTATTLVEEESSEFEQPEIIAKPSKKGSSSTKSKPSHNEQVAAADLFADDDDDMGGYVPPPSKVASPVELPPLFVPKRGAKAKTTSVEPETGATRPVEKEKKKPGRPPKSKARAPSPARVAPAEDEEWPAENHHAPLSPASNNTPQSAAREKAPTSKAGGKLDEGRTVVNVSTDDEEEKEIEDAKKAKKINLGVEGKENARVSLAEVVIATTKKEKKQEQLSLETPIVHVPPKSPEAEGEDVQMNDVNSEGPAAAPRTPPRATPQALPTIILPPSMNNTTVSTDPEPILIPALSKLPFTPLHTLTEAELDMTVEEWIRYQMEVEYDKFKRDGERELLRFKKRAEDVRKIIDGL